MSAYTGAKIRSLRTRADLAQSTFGTFIGVTASFVSRLETGDREPTRDLLDTICDALDVSTPERIDLLMSAGYMPSVDTDDHVIRALLETFVIVATMPRDEPATSHVLASLRLVNDLASCQAGKDAVKYVQQRRTSDATDETETTDEHHEARSPHERLVRNRRVPESAQGFIHQRVVLADQTDV